MVCEFQINAFFSLYAVTELKYERIAPKLDGDNINGSTEFRFTVPATSEYFTRYIKNMLIFYLTVVIYICFF